MPSNCSEGGREGGREEGREKVMERERGKGRRQRKKRRERGGKWRLLSQETKISKKDIKHNIP
jgi:hypothetical protein